MRRVKMAEKPEVALRNAEIPFIGIPVGRFRTPREINEWHQKRLQAKVSRNPGIAAK